MKKEIVLQALPKFINFAAKTPKDVARIKAYKPCTNQSNAINRVMNSGFCKYVCQGKESEYFEFADPFQDGYAYVVPRGQTPGKEVGYYIDKDFDPVLNERKIKTPSDLIKVILTSPNSVAKYVAPETIQSIRDDLTVKLITVKKATPAQDLCLSQIEGFISANKVQQG